MTERNKPMTVYQRIMQAARRDKGVRLSADEVFALSMDSAISTRAELDEFGDEEADQKSEGQ